MSQFEDLSFAAKGKINIAEALKELDTVQQAFKITQRLESRVDSQDLILQELSSKADSLVSYSYVNSRLEDQKSHLLKIVKDKFDDLTSTFFNQLNEKINRNEIESHVAKSCTWIAFNNLTQNVSSLKSRLDKHIFSDFEGLKTKMKIQFGDKYTELMNTSLSIKEEFSQIKLRLAAAEQKLQEMFVDDGLGESEDYDSQEENDNINQNLGDRDSIEDEEEPPPQKIEYEKPNVKITEPKDEEKVSEPEESKNAESNGIKSEVKIDQQAQIKETPKAEDKAVEQKELTKSEPVIELKTESKVDQKIEPAEPRPEPKIEQKVEPKINLKIEITEEPKPEKTEEIKTNNLLPKPESPSQDKHSDEGLPKDQSGGKKTDQDKLSASRGNALEIPDRPHRRREEDGASSKNKRGGSSAGDALSRKNSMSSSMGGMGAGAAGGLRNINKKLTSLQKDLETFKAGLDENKGTFDEVREEISKIYDKIGSVKIRCEEIEKNRQGMEISFIKALRRSGKDKKSPVKQQAETVSGKDLKKIYSQLHEKSVKITGMETVVEKVALDMKFVKTQFQDKLNEVIIAIHSFDNYRKESSKGADLFENKLKSLEDKLNSFGSTISFEFESLKGPMTELISDQQRENEMLEENLKRHRQGLKELIDECSLSRKNFPIDSIMPSRMTTTQPRARKSAESPRVSIKHRFFETNNSFRIANPPLKAEENWLTGFPDGKTLALPKVGIKKSKGSLGSDDIRRTL